MKTDLIDAVTSPPSDPEFTQKYFFVVLATLASVLVLPAILLAGYLVETIKHSSSGKKGLPEWKNYTELMVQGGICSLSGLYMLPAALLLAMAWMLFDKASFFSSRAMLSNFISFGALVVGLAGLALSLTGIHTYLRSNRLGDLFNIGPIITKLKLHSGEFSGLLGLAGVVIFVLYIVQALFGLPGLILNLLCSPFLALVLAFGTGHILGATVEAEESAKSLLEAESSTAGLLAEAEVTPSDDEEGLSDSDVWKPK